MRRLGNCLQPNKVTLPYVMSLFQRNTSSNWSMQMYKNPSTLTSRRTIKKYHPNSRAPYIIHWGSVERNHSETSLAEFSHCTKTFSRELYPINCLRSNLHLWVCFPGESDLKHSSLTPPREREMWYLIGRLSSGEENEYIWLSPSPSLSFGPAPVQRGALSSCFCPLWGRHTRFMPQTMLFKVNLGNHQSLLTAMRL